MATSPNTGGFRPVTPAPLRAGIVLSADEARRICEALVTVQRTAGYFAASLIDRLDVLDGDPDLEDSDEDGACDEDEISTMLALGEGDGPGCLISDPDSGADDNGEETNAEDSFLIPGHFLRQAELGAGCALADPGGHDADN